jgi:hypothetical protein
MSIVPIGKETCACRKDGHADKQEKAKPKGYFRRHHARHSKRGGRLRRNDRPASLSMVPIAWRERRARPTSVLPDEPPVFLEIDAGDDVRLCKKQQFEIIV